jgi:CspA family cold shock protein
LRFFLGGVVVQGAIKKLVVDKGFGFIESQPDDMFFHHSVVEGIPFEDLEEGQIVEYEAGEGPKGPRAISVRVAEAAA